MVFPHGRYIRSAVESTTEDEITAEIPPTEQPSLQQPLKLQNEPKRLKRQHKFPPRVHIHNIRSGLPSPEIEVLYTVYQDQEPIPAKLAVSALQEVEDSDVEGLLGLSTVFSYLNIFNIWSVADQEKDVSFF